MFLETFVRARKQIENDNIKKKLDMFEFDANVKN